MERKPNVTCIEDDKLSKIKRGVASPPVHKPLRNYLSYVLTKTLTDVVFTLAQKLSGIVWR